MSGLQAVLAPFGVCTITEEPPQFRVEFSDLAQAYLAKLSLDNKEVEGIASPLRLRWENSSISISRFYSNTDQFYPLFSERKGNPKQLESVEYHCVFPVDLSDLDGFNLKEKILGAKCCNVMKVIDHCAKDTVLPENPQDFLTVTLETATGLSIRVTSRYQDKYRQAVTLVIELINNLVEEYNRFCERNRLCPSDFRIRQFESIRGRARAFQEGVVDPSIYNISTLYE